MQLACESSTVHDNADVHVSGRPQVVVSLYEMLAYNADVFCVLFDTLGRVLGINHVLLGQLLGDESYIRSLRDNLYVARAMSVEHGWTETSEQISEVEKFLFESIQMPQVVRATSLQAKCQSLESHIRRVLRNSLFFHAEAKRTSEFVAWTDKCNPYADVFPRAVYEVSCGASCYLVDQSSACVFHCMRALEIGLWAFANTIGVAISNRDQWEHVIANIEAEIKKINGPHAGTDWREKQDKYSNAALHFRYLKVAWRNHCMHSHDDYDAEKASDICQHVIGFLGDLRAMGLKEVAASAVTQP